MAAISGLLRHSLTISTGFMRNLRMWRRSSFTAPVRMAEALGVPDGKYLDRSWD